MGLNAGRVVQEKKTACVIFFLSFFFRTCRGRVVVIPGILNAVSPTIASQTQETSPVLWWSSGSELETCVSLDWKDSLNVLELHRLIWMSDKVIVEAQEKFCSSDRVQKKKIFLKVISFRRNTSNRCLPRLCHIYLCRLQWNHLTCFFQTQCAPNDRRPGEAWGGQDPISYHTRHCMGTRLFLHLEGSQLDRQSKLRPTLHTQSEKMTLKSPLKGTLNSYITEQIRTQNNYNFLNQTHSPEFHVHAVNMWSTINNANNDQQGC